MLLDARAIGSAGGGGGAPVGATFITQTPNATLTNEQALSALATGILKSTTGTGVVSIAAAGTDYLSPAAIGTTVQAWDADLDTIAGLAKTDGNFIVGDGAAWVVESGATARTSLGLGSIAVLNSPLPIANGGSGQVTQQAAIDALTNVVAATNEHVLTKDTGTGNATFKAAPATGAPVGAKYIVQQADGTLTNEQALGDLATGLLKNTVTSGVLSIAVAGTDYQAADPFLTSIALLGTAADKMIYTTGVDTAAETPLTAFARTILDDANQGAVQSTLALVPGTNIQVFDTFLTSIAALGTAADRMIYTTGVDVAAETGLSAFARSFLDDATEAAFKATVNLEIGVDVQAWDADLDTIAGLAKTDGNFIVGDGAAWVVESGATARASLGLGSLAVLNSPLPIINGGSGQVTQQAAIDALTAVSGATNEHVLTKDTATGNAIFKAAAASAPVGATYITQVADGTLTNEQALAALATGLLKNANGTGVLSIAAEGTDYFNPPFLDTNALVKGSADPTKLLRFEVDGFTAGATRVMTPPNQDTTLAGLSVVQTFTAAQTIDGSADGVQLTVKGHSTQNGDIFQLVNDAGAKVLGIEEVAGYVRYSTGTSNDLHWFQEGFLVTEGANILSTAGGGIGFETGGHLKLVTSAGQSYVKFRHDTRSFGVGGNFIPSATIHGIVEDAVTNATTNVAIFGHNSSGTPAAGYGTDVLFQGKSSTDADQNMARLAALWDVATHASKSAALRVLIFGSGGEVDAAKFDDDATAGNTRLLLYDVDNGQLERVSVGIADSGGAGFKCLRIAN